MSKLTCKTCNFCWQDPDEDFPSCKFSGNELDAPCNYDEEEENYRNEDGDY